MVIQSINKHLGGPAMGWAQCLLQVCQHGGLFLESMQLKELLYSTDTNELEFRGDSSKHQLEGQLG